jgi:E3 ubiquitin-protein ligase HUWE1
LDAHFTRSFYKNILGLRVVFNDLESIDPEYYQNLALFLRKPHIEDLDLYFELTEDKLGILETKPLIPNGDKIRVTDKVWHHSDRYLSLFYSL